MKRRNHTSGLTLATRKPRMVEPMKTTSAKPSEKVVMLATAATGATSSPTATELKRELKKSLALLQTLRDEVRIRLHLGSLDLKDQWKKLEPHLGEVEKKAEELTEASFAALGDAVKRVEKFRSSLNEHH